MDTLTKRKHGGQPGNLNAVGNWNALKSGKHSARLKAERWAQRQAEAAEERKRFEAWAAPIEARCRRQHAEILEQLRRERAELEAAEARQAAHLRRALCGS
jgi:hypothetical protein